MERTLFIAGAVPFVVLGALHLIYSILDSFHPAKIVPSQPAVIEQMRGSTLKITRQTNVWLAWLGFNISHGLGVLCFGLIYLILATQNFAALRELKVLLLAAPVIAISYLVLSWKYWFRIPTLGSALSAICFTAGCLLSF